MRIAISRCTSISRCAMSKKSGQKAWSSLFQFKLDGTETGAPSPYSNIPLFLILMHFWSQKLNTPQPNDVSFSRKRRKIGHTISTASLQPRHHSDVGAHVSAQSTPSSSRTTEAMERRDAATPMIPITDEDISNVRDSKPSLRKRVLGQIQYEAKREDAYNRDAGPN